MRKFIITARTISEKISKDNITSYAAQSCFYITLSFLPFLVVLLSLVQFLPLSATDFIQMAGDIVPNSMSSLFNNIVYDIYNNSTITVVSITAITTIWSAGKGFTSIIRALNTIYETSDSKNWFSLRLKSTFYTIIFMLMLIVSFILLVFGKNLVNLLYPIFPAVAVILEAILSDKLILFPCILTLMFLLLYTFIPNRKSSFARELPGALLAAFGWYVFSYVYSLYISYSTSHSSMYGSLTSLILALIWLYFCMIIIFFGAEINFHIKKYLFKK